jgi:LDH2 family malate/lactate/ureidoglycolate dehydrogenase
MTEPEIRTHPDSLRTFVRQVFDDAGCAPAVARDMAECMVQTNLWGIDSHGVIRVPEYHARFRSGAMNANPVITSLRESGGIEILDADNGPGYSAGRAAMSRAIDKAAAGHLSMVGVINSNHCGATALYTRMAADRGLIGVAMTNVAPNMAMPGISTPVTGNNPLAVAVPTFGDFPFSLDISLSAVAGGKLLLAARKGEPIPEGWAVDASGQPTTDPKAGFDGYLLPMGGHKGFGLSLLVDILCGVLTGGSFQNQVKSMYRYPDDPSKTAHLMMVIDPLALMGREAFRDRMAEFVGNLRALPAGEGTEMLLPGEIEYRTEQKRLAQGIPLPAAVATELKRIGNETNRSLDNE